MLLRWPSKLFSLIIVSWLVRSPSDLACTCYYDLALLKCHQDQPYTIHGLWPEGCKVDTWPQYCSNNQPFNLSQISDLVPQMNQVWYSCQGNNPGFWEHEWMKHGTCTGLTQRKYFELTLNLYNKVKPQSVSESCDKDKLECKISFGVNITKT